MNSLLELLIWTDIYRKLFIYSAPLFPKREELGWRTLIVAQALLFLSVVDIREINENAVRELEPGRKFESR